MKKQIVYILIFICVLGCSPSNKSIKVSDEELSIIDEFEQLLIEKLPDNRSISGVIIKGDEVIWSKAFGVSNLETYALADTNTIYRTGSISKSFTAFLMMLLVQDGIVKLDDPVEIYLQEITKLKGYSDSTKITLLQLANHTSGLYREPGLNDAAVGPIEEWENRILESIPTTAFEFRPGKKFSYSNIGYGILGLALSRAANKPFMRLMEERIFLPLNMKSSYFIIPKDKMSDLSAGIMGPPGDRINTEIPKKEHEGRGYKVPNGGIYSTPNDLAKFLMCNTGSSLDLLVDEDLVLMQSEELNLGENKFYGMGFFVDTYDHTTIVHHGGAVAGYNANFAFEKKDGYGVILMRNYMQGEPNIWELPHELLISLSKLNSN